MPTDEQYQMAAMETVSAYKAKPIKVDRTMNGAIVTVEIFVPNSDVPNEEHFEW